MSIAGFDHVAIPTRNPEAMIAFYRDLGFAVPDEAEWRESQRPFFSVQFGDHKINVHAPAPRWWRAPSSVLAGETEVGLGGPASTRATPTGTSSSSSFTTEGPDGVAAPGRAAGMPGAVRR
jgi:catechol 2,3-dioxygenase-like lactoylglutathione lyase family enzyme